MQSHIIENSYSDLHQDLQDHINSFLESLKNNNAGATINKIKKTADSSIYYPDIQWKLAGKLARWVNEVHTPMVARTAPELTAQIQLNPALSSQLQFFMRLYRYHQNPTSLQRDLLWLMVAGQPFYAKMLPLFLSSIGADNKKYSEALAEIVFPHFGTDYYPLNFSKDVQKALFVKILTTANPPYDYLRSRLLGLMSTEDAEHYLSTLHLYEMNPANLGTVLEALFCKLNNEKAIQLANKMKEINDETHRFDEATFNQLLQKNLEYPTKRIEEKNSSTAKRLTDILSLEKAQSHEALILLMDEIHQHIDVLEKKLCASQTGIDLCSMQQLFNATKQDEEYRKRFDPWPRPILNPRNQLIIPTYCKITESVTKEQQSLIIKPDYLVRFLQSLVLAAFCGERTDELQHQIIQIQQLLSKQEDIVRYIKFIVAVFAEGNNIINDFNSINYHHEFSKQWLDLLCILAALHKGVNLNQYLSYKDVCAVLSGWHDFHAMTADHPHYQIALFENLNIIINIMSPAEKQNYLAEQLANKSRSVIWLAAVMQLPLSKEAALCFFDNVSKNQSYIHTYKSLRKYLPACFSLFLKESTSEFATQLMLLLKNYHAKGMGYELLSLLMQDPSLETKQLAQLLIPELLKWMEFPNEEMIKKCEENVEHHYEFKKQNAETKQQIYQPPTPEEITKKMRGALRDESIFHAGNINIATNIIAIMSPYFSAQQTELFFSLLEKILTHEYLNIHHSSALIEFILTKPHSPFNQQILKMIIPNLLSELAEAGWHRRTGTPELIATLYPLFTPAEKQQVIFLLADNFSKYNEYDIGNDSIIAQPTISCLSQSMAEEISPDLLIRMSESIINQLYDPSNHQKNYLARYATWVLSYLSSCLEVIPYDAQLHAKISELSKKVQQHYISSGAIPAESIRVAATVTTGIRLFDRRVDDVNAASSSSLTADTPKAMQI
ncbi:MAG: hypothetical protein P4M12_04840 [Gammaproteobacteria bacterium]|nr:hypothetical protein [Gammaproteobacteria bacterium]